MRQAAARRTTPDENYRPMWAIEQRNAFVLA
jgi:hypothetical protein